MGGGEIQLVAYGIENIYLTSDPQITFFKTVYRRHTNFSTEEIPLYFNQIPNFGEKVSCIINSEGDLLNNIGIVIKLPLIKDLSNENTVINNYNYSDYQYNKFAWVRKIGYHILKSVEIEINGRVIDRHYGEWLNIWNELTMSSDQIEGNNINIGNIPQLYNFTSNKNEYILRIPLQFWFCRGSGLSLPIVSLQYSQIKINVEFNDLDDCFIKSPTHYIECTNNILNCVKYEYIEQNINNEIRSGLFVDYDIFNKRLYYIKLSSKKLIGFNSDSTSILTENQKNELLQTNDAKKYIIKGNKSKFEIIPIINGISKSNFISSFDYINISESYLLVNYIFLDEEERLKISQVKHEYLIEQLYFTPTTKLEGLNRNIKLTIEQPCKLITWITQREDIYNSGDIFNYTDSFIKKLYISDDDVLIGEELGKSLILEETLLLNGKERISLRKNNYFNYCLSYENSKYNLSEGINLYSFALNPSQVQPSGTCNMSQIDSIELKLSLSELININNQVNFRAYSLVYNILRISNGLAGLLFTR